MIGFVLGFLYAIAGIVLISLVIESEFLGSESIFILDSIEDKVPENDFMSIISAILHIVMWPAFIAGACYIKLFRLIFE